MDIWQKMYEKAQALYQPQEVSDFVYARHVVAAVEAEDGQIFTGFCMEGTCDVFHLCSSHQFSIKVMCRLFQVSRSSYYAFKSHQPSQRDQENKLLKNVSKILTEFQA